MAMNVSRILSRALAAGLVALSAAIATPAAAQAPTGRFIPYKGQLERNGALVTGNVNITFEIYAAQSGGAPLHAETKAVVLTAGSFATQIGPVPDSVFDAPSLYIGLVVEGTPLGGRQLVQTSPYAVRGQPGQPFTVDSLAITGGGLTTTLTNGTSPDFPSNPGLVLPGDVVLQGNLLTNRMSAFNVIQNTNLNHFGGGFLEATFNDPGGTIIIHASASAFCTTQGRIIMQVRVDGTTVSSMRAYCHVTNQHITLPSTLFELPRNQFAAPAAGQSITRTLRIQPINCTSGCTSPIVTTSVDANDFGEATIIRLPGY